MQDEPPGTRREARCISATACGMPGDAERIPGRVRIDHLALHR